MIEVRGAWRGTRKVDARLPGKRNSNSHEARPVHQIITMIKWIRTSRLSITLRGGTSRTSPAPSVRLETCSGSGIRVKGYVKRFRGGLIFKAHRWLYHSTLGSRVIKKKKKVKG